MQYARCVGRGMNAGQPILWDDGVEKRQVSSLPTIREVVSRRGGVIIWMALDQILSIVTASRGVARCHICRLRFGCSWRRVPSEVR